MGGHCLCLPAKHRDTAAHIQYFTAELKTRINSMDKSAVQCVLPQSGTLHVWKLVLKCEKNTLFKWSVSKQTASSRQSEFQEALMKYTFQRPDVTEGQMFWNEYKTQRKSIFILIVMLSVFVSLCIALCFNIQNNNK